MSDLSKKKYWVLVGTRPEVIKQIPVYLALKQEFGDESVALVGTGQHKELLSQALDYFNVSLDANLDIMAPGQLLVESAGLILTKTGALLSSCRPEWVFVQGDTTTAAMVAWACFLNQINVAHVEAGLRSYDLQNPFPEEANRRLIALVANLHFAPTELAREALLKEGIKDYNIVTTGNTGIDSLFSALANPISQSAEEIIKHFSQMGVKPVLLTAHRRENKSGMEEWFLALRSFFLINKELGLVYPIHPNHAAKPSAEKYLSDLDNVKMVPALDYGSTCHVLKRCSFVVTDSGGIQEEAATLNIPVVVCRKTTERMEAVNAGIAKLVGTETQSVVSGMNWAKALSQNNPDTISNLFGDGRAGWRIAQMMANLG